MSARILIAGPWITEKEIRCVTEAVADGWYANASKYQTEFEQAFAAATGRRHAMALPSCTSGLHLALLALGVGPGRRGSGARRHLEAHDIDYILEHFDDYIDVNERSGPAR
jgi:hypothetical protein